MQCPHVAKTCGRFGLVWKVKLQSGKMTDNIKIQLPWGWELPAARRNFVTHWTHNRILKWLSSPLCLGFKPRPPLFKIILKLTVIPKTTETFYMWILFHKMNFVLKGLQFKFSQQHKYPFREVIWLNLINGLIWFITQFVCFVIGKNLFKDGNVRDV